MLTLSSCGSASLAAFRPGRKARSYIHGFVLSVSACIFVILGFLVTLEDDGADSNDSMRLLPRLGTSSSSLAFAMIVAVT